VSPSTIRKVVIPAAGWGTRFLPVTKVVPKEVLPIIDQPVIAYALQEAALTGLSEVVLVTSEHKEAIENYFRPNPELEAFLTGKGDQRRLELLHKLTQLPRVTTVLQRQQLGLGHAVLVAREAVGREAFAVLLPDDVVEAPVPALKQLLRVHAQYGCSVLAVVKVPKSEVSRYGVIDPEVAGPKTYRVKGVVEKPRAADAPSDLAIIGRYIFTPEIFDELVTVRPGAIGEIQLTDGIAALLKRQPVYAVELEGQLLDAGTPLGLLKASVQTALRRPDMGPELRAWLEATLRG